jgi:hypothetical protein
MRMGAKYIEGRWLWEAQRRLAGVVRGRGLALVRVATGDRIVAATVSCY